MKRWLLDYLPSLPSGQSYQIDEKEVKGDEILEGTISIAGGCIDNGNEITIKQGVAIMAGDAARESKTAESFGFEWGSHLEGKIEKDSSFGYTVESEVKRFLTSCHIKEEDLSDLSILDAGCGSARMTVGLAKMGAKHIIGIDINPAIFAANKIAQSLPNLMLVQNSVLSPKLKRESFDVIWSNGVLHHTPNPKAGFDALAKLVKPGGSLYIWLYGTHWSPLVDVRKILLFLGMRKWSNKTIMSISRFFAFWALFPVWGLKILARFVPEVDKHPISRNVIARWGSYGALKMIWFDLLSPKYRYQYSRDTLRQWFIEAGFEILDSDDYHTGFLGRKKQ